MRFNHMYTIAFEVKTDNPADRVEEHEILAALIGRARDMVANKEEIFERSAVPMTPLTKVSQFVLSAPVVASCGYFTVTEIAAVYRRIAGMKGESTSPRRLGDID